MRHTLRDVGVVIVTHNSADDVPRALQALPTDRLAGVVVVDNASVDDTPEVVEAMALPNVSVVRAPNLGFGAGCNAGLQALRDVPRTLLLNPDAVISEDSLLLLVEYLVANPIVAVVAPRLYCGDEALTSAGRLATTISELRFVLPPRVGRLIPDRRLPPGYSTSGRVGVVEGACLLLDAKLIRQLGGFDESYFLFFEEHDLARRVAASGREIHLCAQARAQHGVGASRETLPLQGRDHYMASTVRYLRSWAPPGGALLISAAARVTWAWQARTGRLSGTDHALMKAGLEEAKRGGGASRPRATRPPAAS